MNPVRNNFIRTNAISNGMNYWWTSDYGSASFIPSKVEGLTTGHFSSPAVSAFKKEEKKGVVPDKV